MLEPQHIVKKPQPLSPLDGASACVLVVDDEAMVRDLCAAIIARAGFRAITAPDGPSAIEAFKAQKESISCVLLDVTMPGMDGPEVFKALQEIEPKVKIALSSGHCEEDIASRFEGLKFAGFIQKPFQLDALRLELLRVIAEPL